MIYRVTISIPERCKVSETELNRVIVTVSNYEYVENSNEKEIYVIMAADIPEGEIWPEAWAGLLDNVRAKVEPPAYEVWKKCNATLYILKVVVRYAGSDVIVDAKLEDCKRITECKPDKEYSKLSCEWVRYVEVKTADGNTYKLYERDVGIKLPGLVFEILEGLFHE